MLATVAHDGLCGSGRTNGMQRTCLVSVEHWRYVAHLKCAFPPFVLPPLFLEGRLAEHACLSPSPAL